jgi:hypothetical protein
MTSSEQTRESEGLAATATATAIEIFEPANSGAGRHTYLISVRKSNGEPYPGVDVAIKMEGAGSLAPAMSSTAIYRETDAAGAARFTWFRRSIFSRDVKASLSISVASEGARLSVEETAAESAHTSYQQPGGMTRL